MKRKSLFLIILFLLPSLVFGGSLKSPQINFKNHYGIDPLIAENLVILLDQKNGISYGSTQTWYNIAPYIRGGFNHTDIDQPTADNQPTLADTYRTFSTNDFMRQEEIDDETGVTFWPTYPGLITTAGSAAIRLQGLNLASLYGVSSGNSTHRLVLKDSGGDVISWGYIRGADSAEALGGELVTNGTMEADANWVGGSRSNEQKHGGTYSRKFVTVGAAEGIYNDGDNWTTTTGKAYKATAWLYPSAGVTTIKIYVRAGDNSAWTVAATPTGLTPESWNEWEFNFTEDAGGAGAYIYFESQAGGETWYVDDVSIKPYNSFGTDGVLINSTVAGGTQSWTGTGAGDPNDPSTIEIYKVIGDLTGDVTYETIITPTDGQPATDQVLIANANYTAGQYAFSVKLLTTGKLECVVSSDGSTKTGKVTDDAVFADGAQTSAKHIIVTYDASGQTITFYVNGAAVASTNLGGGGPPTSIYDTWHPITIGAEAGGGLYYNGRKHLEQILNTAISAAQALSKYNALSGRL